MNRRAVVLAIAVLAIGGFTTAAYVYNKAAVNGPAAPVRESNTLVRPHSPVMGPIDAKVTIVEFFDPSCEACRAFYPVVKQLLAQYPQDLRVVLRYTPFHKGSDDAVRILETARLQNVFEPVLQALLASQPDWAPHDGPQLDKAWAAAGAAGLDVVRAKQAMMAPEITATLKQDVDDVKAVGITGTPTFFVNGKPLPSFGAQQLRDLVKAEIAAAK